ncbi:hypothetical protein AB0M22_18450 [Nocardia sp. NPDC051756]|uniref:hypothetical protein n=1 Tax=Nocardia sp. NPDC051756 TaxID=3154751 RepID=UPI003439E83A
MLNSHRPPAGGAERVDDVEDQVNPDATVVLPPEPQPIADVRTPRTILRAIKVDAWLLAGSIMTAATCAHLAGSGLPEDAPHRTLAAGAAVFAGRAGWSSVRALWRYFGPEEIYFGVRFRHPRR